MATYMIRPTTITEAMLWGSNIPENDFSASEYNAGSTYATDDYCIVTSSFPHRVYQSLQGPNIGHTPASEPTWWNDLKGTNRCAVFDQVVGHQASQATSLSIILEPGMFDSCAMLNVDAGVYRMSISDSSTDLITNGTDWTGASGTTQPNSWDKVGDPSDFTIDSGALKITADANGEGISQTMAVVAETDMQFFGKYRNTTGDIAQYSIYDVTNGAYITAATDLASSVTESIFSDIFTVPTGCVSVRVSLLAKANTDIVWFDSVHLNECVYDTGEVSLVSTIAVVDYKTWFFEPIVMATDIARTDIATSTLSPFSNSVLTITLTTDGGTPKAGEIVLGLQREIGAMLTQPEYTIKNYDTVEEDETYGGFNIVPHTWAKRLQCTLIMKTNIYDEVNRLLTLYRSTPTVYVGYEPSSSLIIYGIVGDFSNSRINNSYCEASLKILGLI